MNNAGKIGPPTKPLPMLTAKVRIFASKIATRRPRPRVPASCKTLLSWSLPVNRVSGNATPMKPNTTPPSVDFAMLGIGNRVNKRVNPAVAATNTVATTAASRPSGIAASSCQSSNLYDGTL